MNSTISSTYTLNHGFDPEALAPDCIPLSPDQLQIAAQRAAQWQDYLNQLAQFGLENWLQARAADLHIESQPIESQLQGIRVGTFRVRAIALGSLPDTVIEVATSWLTPSPSAPHFYALVEVLEEQGQTRIHGYLRHDQLMQRQQATPLSQPIAGICGLPLEWFNPNADQLLLHLRCLQQHSQQLQQKQQQVQSVHPTALPASRPGVQASNLAGLAAPPSNTPAQPTSAQPTSVERLEAQVKQAANGVTQGAVNTALWLQNQLDAIAQSSQWLLLPRPTFATEPLPALRSMRLQSPIHEIDHVLTRLRQSGVEIPNRARGVCQEFLGTHAALRLYALIWDCSGGGSCAQQEPEWSLLVILGAQPGTLLPDGICLRIEDDTQVLVRRSLASDELEAHLYGQVIGKWSETFRVSIQLADGSGLKLPPFAFRPI